jgi:hypothetical protein
MKSSLPPSSSKEKLSISTENGKRSKTGGIAARTREELHLTVSIDRRRETDRLLNNSLPWSILSQPRLTSASYSYKVSFKLEIPSCSRDVLPVISSKVSNQNAFSFTSPYVRHLPKHVWVGLSLIYGHYIFAGSRSCGDPDFIRPSVDTKLSWLSEFLSSTTKNNIQACAGERLVSS